MAMFSIHTETSHQILIISVLDGGGQGLYERSGLALIEDSTWVNDQYLRWCIFSIEYICH